MGFLRLYCYCIVIRVFNPRGYLSVIRVSSVNSVVMVIMIMWVLRKAKHCDDEKCYVIATWVIRVVWVSLVPVWYIVCSDYASFYFFPRRDSDSMVWIALYVDDLTLWFFVCDCIYSGLLTMVIKVSLALLAWLEILDLSVIWFLWVVCLFCSLGLFAPEW